MNKNQMKFPKPGISRRQFIDAAAIGCLAASSAALAGSVKLAGAETDSGSANPFAYDLSRFTTTDPKLIRYEEIGRVSCPHPQPRRITVGPDDRIYVATRDGVDMLNRADGQRESIKLAAPARCVAVAADGIVYAGLKDRVEIFSRTGDRTASWEVPGSKAWLSGLAVGESDVLAADSGNRLIWRYDRSGKLAARIGQKSRERQIPGLIVPSPYLDVALGRDGLLRVNNPGRHCVELYTLDGELELSWGKASAAIDGFCGCCNPIGVALLSDGSCVTCEKGLPRVKIYSPERNLDCVVAGPESFSGNTKAPESTDGTVGGLDAAIDSHGYIHILDLVTAEIRIMSRKT